MKKKIQTKIINIIINYGFKKPLTLWALWFLTFLFSILFLYLDVETDKSL